MDWPLVLSPKCMPRQGQALQYSLKLSQTGEAASANQGGGKNSRVFSHVVKSSTDMILATIEDKEDANMICMDQF